MAISLETSRASFLGNAALAYAQIDPATSAYLNVHRNLDGKVSDEQLSCTACGTILMHTFTSSIQIAKEAQTSRSKSPNFARARAGKVSKKSLQTECLKCHRYVRHALPQSPSGLARYNSIGKKPASKVPEPDKPHSSILTKSTQKPLRSNASSKLRAKVRKGGLQAMLEKSKQDLAGDKVGGLELMDFLK